MSGAAIKFRDWKRGTDPVTPTPGVDNFAACMPITEPLTSGPPPLAPDLVEGIESGWLLWRRGCRSGQVVSGPLATATRPRWRVKWTGVTKAERNSLFEFLRDTCGDGLFAWDLEVDGAGQGEMAVVRALGPAAGTWVNKPGYSVEVEVEEVFS